MVSCNASCIIVQMGMESVCITVQPTDALRSVCREWHTRKPLCYILEDRYEKYLFLAQRLHVLSSYINTLAPDRASRVSITALHEIAGTSENRVCGWSKHRWRVRTVPLEEAGELFEKERGRFQYALILGQRNCYQIEGV